MKRLLAQEHATPMKKIVVTVDNCTPGSPVGLELDANNVLLELRANSPADIANVFRLGDRILVVDDEPLGGRMLTAVMQPRDQHTFELERNLEPTNVVSFSVEEEAEVVDDEDEAAPIEKRRVVHLAKVDGKVGINPEINFDGESETLRIAKVYGGTSASASGIVEVGDCVCAINGTPLVAQAEGTLLARAFELLGQTADGDEVELELESSLLRAGWMQKKGEKGLFKSMQRRFFTLIWSDFNLAEREIRYYDGQDCSTRKMKGTINLASFTDVRAESIDGATGFTITTPGRVWELVPDTAAEVNEWVALLSKLLHHTRGFSVIASMSNLALIDAASGADCGDERRKQGELTVILKRKLGISISKLGQDIAVAQMEPDGAAAASGVISPGDALLAANGVELHGCKQAIKLLTKSAGVVKLRAATRVVRGGYMHKLGEGLGGWTTRFFCLAYELEELPPPAATPLAKTLGLSSKAAASGKMRQRAASAAPKAPPSILTGRLHKESALDKLGMALAQADEGRVIISKIYPGYAAADNASFAVGDVLVAVNGSEVRDQPHALQMLLDATGDIDLKLERNPSPGCWVLRYYDGKNSMTRTEKGSIRLDRKSVREINKYTLREEDAADGVPRNGLYILQDERCWELLPPEDELDGWIRCLQLAVFGQDVISMELATPEGAAAAMPLVAELTGVRTVTLQQQYGLVLCTYDKPPPNAITPPSGDVKKAVYLMNFEMDGAGACCGLLRTNDLILEVDGVPADDLASVTKTFKSSSHAVKVKVATHVVHGGYMLKKGEINQDFQLRFFILTDNPATETSVLAYYEGCNAVTRVHRGDIKISPIDVTGVRQMTYEDPATGEKTPGIVISTPSRQWELLCERVAEARFWATLLVERTRGKSITAAQLAQAEEPNNVMAPPTSTRL